MATNHESSNLSTTNRISRPPESAARHILPSNVEAGFVSIRVMYLLLERACNVGLRVLETQLLAFFARSIHFVPVELDWSTARFCSLYPWYSCGVLQVLEVGCRLTA